MIITGILDFVNSIEFCYGYEFLQQRIGKKHAS